jgi:ribosomal protein S9
MFALLQQFGRRKNAIAPQILSTAVERYRSTIN